MKGGKAAIFDMTAGGRIQASIENSDELQDACFSPDDSKLATISGSDSTLERIFRIWNAQTGALVCEPLKAECHDTKVAFSPDGTMVACCTDNAVRIFGTADGRPLCAALRPGPGMIESVQFSPDSVGILILSADSHPRIWKVATGTPMTIPFGLGSDVHTACFGCDGSNVLITTERGEARIYDVSFLKKKLLPVPSWMLDRAKAIAGLEFDSSGNLNQMPPERRISILQSPVPKGTAWTAIANWLNSPPKDRTVTPDNSMTFFEIAKRDRDSGTIDGLFEALRYDCTIPLARLLLAGKLLDEDAKASPENRDPVLSQRTAFLRDYDLDRLPPDLNLWGRASRELGHQHDLGRARRAQNEWEKLKSEAQTTE